MRRVWALVRKEARQIIRDPSSIAIGVVLPVLLILLFGYGLSLDVKHVPVAVVLEDPSPEATELAAGFQLSPYFDAQLLTSMPRAQELMLARKVDGIVRMRPDFARHLSLGDAEVQILVHGTDANRARIIQSYAQGAVSQWAARAAQGQEVSSGPVVVADRLWFNEANESRYFLVPGLIVLIMTLIGALLTALVMAREWERGTLEALFVTPVRADEILLGKTIPYFVLGMVGLVLCLLAAKFLFHVPFRGSVWVLTGVSMLYLLVALGIGLLISSAVKSQFVASQVALLVTFMPAVMLSGFLFDLRSMPAPVRLITYALPARYYVDPAADDLPGRGRLGSHPAECGRAGRHGGRVPVLTRGATRKNSPEALYARRYPPHPRPHTQGAAGHPQGPAQPLQPPGPADAAVPDLRVRGDVRPERRAIRGLDHDRSAASRDLLARLDGSGVFRRVANLDRADVKTIINERRALLVIQIDQDFERRLLAGQSADVQVIADGRNSNTAGTAMGYVGSIVEHV